MEQYLILDEASMQGLWLRTAVAEDVEALTEIFLQARQAAMPYLPSLHTDQEVSYWLANFVMPNARLTVATVGDARPVGFCACRHGQLDHLYVAPAAQGCGAGTLLLADAMVSNPDGLRLHVFQRNIRARAFYERHGFRLAELRDGSQNEEHEPDAVYDWRPQRQPGSRNERHRTGNSHR